jgi:hypothetical protein
MAAAVILTLILTIGVPLAIVLFVLIKLRRPIIGALSRLPVVLGQRSGTYVALVATVLVLGASLFLGFVGAAVLAGVAPTTVGFAADLACAGVVEHTSQAYSYKPGQSGISQEWTCTSAGGETQRIVGLTYVYAAAIFSAGIAAVLGVLAAVGWLLLKRHSLRAT